MFNQEEKRKNKTSHEEYAREITGKEVDAQLSDYGQPVKQLGKAWGSQRPEYELYPGE